MARPAGGVWRLGVGVDDAPRAFLRIHQNLHEMNMLGKLDEVIYEEPADPGVFQRNMRFDVTKALIGLANHVDSYCEAKGIRCRSVAMAKWRRHFIGAMKRGTKSKQLKDYAMERCRELGLEFEKHDTAEAHGILDYRLNQLGIEAPWRKDHPLVKVLA